MLDTFIQAVVLQSRDSEMANEVLFSPCQILVVKESGEVSINELSYGFNPIELWT
jgi:hypothetical protein